MTFDLTFLAGRCTAPHLTLSSRVPGAVFYTLNGHDDFYVSLLMTPAVLRHLMNRRVIYQYIHRESFKIVFIVFLYQFTFYVFLKVFMCPYYVCCIVLSVCGAASWRNE